MRVAIVNVAIGSWYPEGQERLRETVRMFHPDWAFYGWQRETTPPSWYTRPECKEFKIHAIERAFEVANVVFWMDSSVWLIRPMDRVLAHVSQHGIALWDVAGWHVAQFAAPEVVREWGPETGEMPNVAGGVIGLHRQDPRARRFLHEWRKLLPLQQYEGHTRDQPMLSKVAWDLGVPTIHARWWRYWSEAGLPEDTCLVCRGGYADGWREWSERQTQNPRFRRGPAAGDRGEVGGPLPDPAVGLPAPERKE